MEDTKKVINKDLNLKYFDIVFKFKSAPRAIRRGHADIDGYLYPSRPFNNRANTSRRTNVHSRKMNILKQKVYGQYFL